MSPKRSNIERLKNVAFWLWEYQRRNPHYRRYMDVLARYDEYFKGIGEYDYINSKEFIDEVIAYCTQDCEFDLRNNPIMDRIKKDHGEEAAKRLFKYCFLADSFLERFKRINKCYSIGMDTDDVLKKLLNGGSYVFETNDPQDYGALLRMYSGWAMQLGNANPDLYAYILEKVEHITIDPAKVFEKPDSLGREGHALKLYRSLVENLFSKQFISNETLGAVYHLSLSGDYINSSNEMRLCTLWIWDRIQAAGDPDVGFLEVYRELRRMVAQSCLDGKGWDQIINKRSRLLKSFKTLENAILQLTVLPLQSS